MPKKKKTAMEMTTEELAKFLPVPIVTFDGQNYHLDYNRPQSIGKVREFFGNIQIPLKQPLGKLGTQLLVIKN